MDFFKDDNDRVAVNHMFVLFKRFYHFARPDISRNIINMLVIFLTVITGAIIIWMVGQGLDALTQSRLNVVPGYLLAFLSLVILLQLLRYINYYLVEWMEQRAIFTIRKTLYTHMLDLGTPFKDSHATGDMLTRLGQDVSRVSEFLILLPAQIFNYGITLLMYLAILFYIDTWLTLLTLLFVPLIVLQQRMFIKKTRQSAQDFLHYQGRMTSFEEDSLRNILGIATFSAEKSMNASFDSLFARFRHAAMRNLLLNNAFVVTFELLIAVAAILLVTLGVYQMGQNELTIGALVNFLLYLGYMSVPLRGIAKIPIESQVRAVAAQRVAEILDKPPHITETLTPKKLSRDPGLIRFDKVKFAYHDQTPVLNDIRLSIQPCEQVAIMGTSGIGKSTMAKLLLRLYDPDHGRILIDGIDIRDISLSVLRTHIAAVWQEPFLIDDTIYANMRLSRPDASEEQIHQALADAHAKEFIEKLPQGYYTRLGNHGAQLSTGQKQRIAIAQALIKKPKILILDESTSALDSESELAIQLTIQELKNRCTVIVIAHRLSSMANMDRIIYFNKNGVLSIGTQQELKKHNADFQKALAHQKIDED